MQKLPKIGDTNEKQQSEVLNLLQVLNEGWAHGSLKVTPLIQTHTGVERTNYRGTLMNVDLNQDGGWGGVGWCLEDERIYGAERRMWFYRTVANKKIVHSIQPALVHTPENCQLQRRSRRGFSPFPHAVHTRKWLSTTSTPVTRQGQRDWMNLQNCQICSSGCAAPGIRFQGFYVLFMRAYRSSPFIVPSLHNS